jgi:hypothetical protein
MLAIGEAGNRAAVSYKLGTRQPAGRCGPCRIALVLHRGRLCPLYFFTVRASVSRIKLR